MDDAMTDITRNSNGITISGQESQKLSTSTALAVVTTLKMTKQNFEIIEENISFDDLSNIFEWVR